MSGMHVTLIGLGNPGGEYEGTRHNTGRDFVLYAVHALKAEEPAFDKKSNALISKARMGKHALLGVMPQTFMNRSGVSAKTLIKSKKAAEALVVAYDDLDLPLGAIKISFGRSSGGHNGVESIIKALKTRDFLRIRIGVSPATPSGKTKKPSGEKAVLDFLMKKRRPAEDEALKRVFKKALEALEVFAERGREVAMSRFN